jgi:hypothetical protein
MYQAMRTAGEVKTLCESATVLRCTTLPVLVNISSIYKKFFQNNTLLQVKPLVSPVEGSSVLPKRSVLFREYFDNGKSSCDLLLLLLMYNHCQKPVCYDCLSFFYRYFAYRVSLYCSRAANKIRR